MKTTTYHNMRFMASSSKEDIQELIKSLHAQKTKKYGATSYKDHEEMLGSKSTLLAKHHKA